jgi:hypothetical protein
MIAVQIAYFVFSVFVAALWGYFAHILFNEYESWQEESYVNNSMRYVGYLCVFLCYLSCTAAVYFLFQIIPCSDACNPLEAFCKACK